MKWTDKKLYELGLKAFSLPEEKRYFGLARYGFGYSNGSVKKATQQACHGSMQRMYDPTKPIVINNMVREGTVSNKNNRRFYDYLMNRSPYSDAYLSKDVGKLEAEGVIVRLVGVPANKSVSASIAVRHTWEHPVIVNTFCDLVNRGLHEDKAFLSAFCIVPQGETYQNAYKAGHVALCVHDLNKSGVRNFLNHTHGKDCGKTNSRNVDDYHTVHSYRGLASLWNDNGVTSSGGLRFDTGLGNLHDFGDPRDPFRILPIIKPMHVKERKKDTTLIEKLEEVFERAGS